MKSLQHNERDPDEHVSISDAYNTNIDKRRAHINEQIDGKKPTKELLSLSFRSNN